MNLHRIPLLTVILAVGVALVGCSDARDAEPTPAITATDSDSRSGTARAEHDGSDGVGDQGAETAEDWLTVEPAEQLRGYPADSGEFISQAGDGTFLIAYQRWPADETMFRLYDEDWNSLTPLLRVGVRLEFDRALRAGFLANASIAKPSGEYAYRSWVTVSPDGRLEEVADKPTKADPAMAMRAGDLRLHEPWPWQAAAYRPQTRTVFKLDPAPWEGRRASVGLTDTGAACSTVGYQRLNRPLHSTVDDAQPWLAQDLSWLAGKVRPAFCSIHPDRMVVVTMGPRDPNMVYTLVTSPDGKATAVFSEHPLGDEMNGYDLRTFPDGTIAAGTHGGGVYVGTDSTNTDMEYRSWGRSHSNFWDLVGDTLILIESSRRLRVSTDHGQSWRIVDLDLPTR